MDWGKTNRFLLENLQDGENISATASFSFNPLRIFGIWSIPIKIEKLQ